MGKNLTPDCAAISAADKVENDKALKDLIAQPERKARNYKYVWFPTSEVLSIATAMLNDPKYFQFLNAKPLHVFLESVRETKPTRTVLHAQGILTGGGTVHVLVNHWLSRGGGVKESDPFLQIAAAVIKKSFIHR